MTKEETDTAVRRLRHRGFLVTQVALFASAIYVYVQVPGWAGFGWGVTLTALMLTRFTKHELERDKDQASEPAAIDLEQVQAQVAKGAMQIVEVMHPIAEAAAGHRATLRKNGWSEEAAEHMAVQFYQAALRSFTEGTLK